MNYSVYPQTLLFTCNLVIGAETYCHFVILNKINIHNTSCVLTCESLLLALYLILYVNTQQDVPRYDIRYTPLRLCRP
jgi:hypothetical protein